jgi:hypothetical protein
LCGEKILSFQSEAESSLATWQSALGGELRLSLKALRSYPPFSDLNVNCVYNVKGFLIDPREDRYFLGKTLYSAYLPDGELIDSDVFLFDDEFSKMSLHHPKAQVDASRRRSLTHELGHWLGLHHIFDGTPSVMSYDQDDDELSDYDRRAVLNLYVPDLN